MLKHVLQFPSIYGYKRTYGTAVPLKYGKLATKYPTIYTAIVLAVSWGPLYYGKTKRRTQNGATELTEK